jgi:hypothetical protein
MGMGINFTIRYIVQFNTDFVSAISVYRHFHIYISLERGKGLYIRQPTKSQN